MEEIKVFYEKVSKSPMLRKKLIWIADEATIAGQKKTKERLIDFVKDAGFDITIEEMRDFFADLAEKKNAEMTDAELETVAGGGEGVQNVFFKLFSEAFS
ncbi:MAG: Nif11-like leader peptide family RiPP precursor [Eubacteriales bacterium]|nr:Nif11-like leader peptide family RiPP precursor [Eubacteriales bacterium]